MPFQIPITNIKNLSNAIIVDSVPESNLCCGAKNLGLGKAMLIFT